ncbi:MAG: hypothetical protein PHF84_00155 [bacterium]|nr:hypothetical protein [bacterium]
MELRTDKINLFWLSRKGLFRFKTWFVLKVVVLFLWGFVILNSYSLYLSQPRLFQASISNKFMFFLFLLLNFIFFVFFMALTILTFKLRQVEFGLYRCSGATRREIITLMFNESLMLTLISFGLLFFFEIIFIYFFRLEIAGLFKVSYDLRFTLGMAKNFLLSLVLVFILLMVCYFPLAVYYSCKDPYEIVRY